jgi:hypothetical protein
MLRIVRAQAGPVDGHCGGVADRLPQGKGMRTVRGAIFLERTAQPPFLRSQLACSTPIMPT